MAEFKIEKNIPAPGRRAKYPFAEMEVGDSFEAPESAKLRTAAYNAGKKSGRKFTCRTHDGALRVWRIK